MRKQAGYHIVYIRVNQKQNHSPKLRAAELYSKQCAIPSQKRRAAVCTGLAGLFFLVIMTSLNSSAWIGRVVLPMARIRASPHARFAG